MATVKFKIERSKLIATGIGEPSLYEIDASNIEALEAVCAKYREETKLPETMEECRARLVKMNDKDFWYSWYEVARAVVSNDPIQDDANRFPLKWQAEKLHALACMEQVWIALHPDGFDWLNGTGSSYHYRYCIYGKDVSLWDHKSGTLGSPFPFRTRELAEQARRILTDDLIKKAFSVK